MIEMPQYAAKATRIGIAQDVAFFKHDIYMVMATDGPLSIDNAQTTRHAEMNQQGAIGGG